MRPDSSPMKQAIIKYALTLRPSLASKYELMDVNLKYEAKHVILFT